MRLEENHSMALQSLLTACNESSVTSHEAAFRWLYALFNTALQEYPYFHPLHSLQKQEEQMHTNTQIHT
jgi:hypothetical protein